MKYRKWMGIAGVVIIALLGAGNAWADDASDCGRFYLQKHYKAAYPVCKRAAAQGDTYAQFSLGLMYDTGQGVKQDYGEAAKWYRKAAEQGYAKAQYNLGVMYAFGRGVMTSGAAAADWFYKAGLSFLKMGNKEQALQSVERIKNLSNVLHLTVPNAFLADKLLARIYD